MPARMRLRRLSNALALGVLLGCLDDGESWRKSSCQYCDPSSLSLSLVPARRSLHTRWERLLQLVGLVGVLEDKGVEALLASDLELGLRDTGALVLLYASSWNTHTVSMLSSFQFRVLDSLSDPPSSVPSTFSHSKLVFRHTASILSPADLDEALDVGDFARHDGGSVGDVRVG